MNDLISFLVSEEAILVYIVALVISIVYIVFYFIKKTSHDRKKKQNTMELKKLSIDVLEEKNKIASQESTLEVKKEVVPEVIENVKPVEEIIDTTKPISVVEPIKEQTVIETPKVEEVMSKPVIEELKAPALEQVAIEVPEVKKIGVAETKAKEEIAYTTVEPKEEEAKKELEKITEQLEKEEDKNIELTEFERMQEDTAIISLDELMKKAGEMYDKNEEVQYQDEGDEPISLAEIEARKNGVSLEPIKEETEVKEPLTLNDLYDVKITPVSELQPISEDKRFKSSPVISPVYGIEKEKKLINENTDIELENTANYEKLDAEIQKTNEFIAALRELQKKLD